MMRAGRLLAVALVVVLPGCRAASSGDTMVLAGARPEGVVFLVRRLG